MRCGPPWGYFPETTKIILVVSPKNIPRAEEYFRGMGLCVFTRSFYLGDFTSEQAVETVWIKNKVQGLTSYLEVMDEVTRQHQKTAHTGM